MLVMYRNPQDWVLEWLYRCEISLSLQGTDGAEYGKL